MFNACVELRQMATTLLAGSQPAAEHAYGHE